MKRRFVTVAVTLVTVTVAAGHAAGPTLFQHGGRATAQVGAFTARGGDAGALSYNPAAVARLDDIHFQIGLDFTAPRDEYESASGSFEADHIITLAPAVYTTYHVPEDRHPFAFGIGVDTESWYFVDWEPALFPGRFRNRHQELVLYDVHPVVGYEIGRRWSVGAGIHYYTGDLETGRNDFVNVDADGDPTAVEAERTTSADVDGLSVDLGLQFTGEVWGWGLALDSGGDIDGDGDVSYEARDVPPDLRGDASLLALLEPGTGVQRFELPWEVRTGLWLSPSPGFELELDLAYQAWSVIERTELDVRPDPFEQRPRTTEVTSRDWDDTFAVRLGAEGRITPHWTLMGGVALEPSPVPDATVEPGFPRADALVYALGVSYATGGIAFDVGYSFHDYDGRSVTGQEPLNPEVSGRYSSRDQVWSVSARWAWR